MRLAPPTILTVVLFALTGCAHDRPAVRFDPGPTLDRHGQPRSLVLAPALDGPHVSGDAHADAWWLDRNDYARGTFVERDGLVYDAAVRRVYDHTHTSAGRVHDHYHEHSRRQRVRLYAP